VTATSDPLLRLAVGDNVAVALRKIAAGERVGLGGITLVAAEEVPMAHKLALEPIAEGAVVTKFGVPIGIATRPIAPGELVHVHNIRSAWITNAVDHAED